MNNIFTAKDFLPLTEKEVRLYSAETCERLAQRTADRANEVLKEYAEKNWPVVYTTEDMDDISRDMTRTWSKDLWHHHGPDEFRYIDRKARLAFIEEIGK